MTAPRTTAALLLALTLTACLHAQQPAPVAPHPAPCDYASEYACPNGSCCSRTASCYCWGGAP